MCARHCSFSQRHGGGETRRGRICLRSTAFRTAVCTQPWPAKPRGAFRLTGPLRSRQNREQRSVIHLPPDVYLQSPETFFFLFFFCFFGEPLEPKTCFSARDEAKRNKEGETGFVRRPAWKRVLPNFNNTNGNDAFAKRARTAKGTRSNSHLLGIADLVVNVLKVKYRFFD